MMTKKKIKTELQELLLSLTHPDTPINPYVQGQIDALELAIELLKLD